MKNKKPRVTMDPEVLKDALECIEQSEADEAGEIEIQTKEPKSQEATGAEKAKDASADDTNDRLVRITADFDNFRKRVKKEKAVLLLHANEDLIRELLPVLDNFERAIEQSRTTEDVQSVREGVEMIFTQLRMILERFGVKPILAVGEEFDPLVHDAINHVPSDEHPANTVIEEHQKGYFLHQRLVRPSLVTVSKGPEEAASGTEDPNGAGDNEKA